MNTAAPASQWKIIVAFALVYVFWGSTYLGIGIAVEEIPPGLMCAARFLIAGITMLASSLCMFKAYLLVVWIISVLIGPLISIRLCRILFAVFNQVYFM